MRSNRKTVFEHSITFYLSLTVGANTKLGGLPGSTGDPVRPREVVTVITACDDGTNR